MKTFEELFRSLPAEDQSHVLAHLHKAILYRGWDQIRAPGCAAVSAVKDIVAVFEKNGIQFEDKT